MFEVGDWVRVKDVFEFRSGWRVVRIGSVGVV